MSHLMKDCQECGVSFRTFPSVLSRGQGKYCSHSCSTKVRHRNGELQKKYLGGEQNPNWHGGKPICIDCGGRCARSDAARCGNCWRVFLNNRLGEFHPAWITDRSQLKKKDERNDSAYKEWRKSVRDMDGWKCKMSNGDCLGEVVAHHILVWRDYPELRYEVNNGITLCHFHHPRKRNDEMILSPFFQELVGVKVN